MINNRFIIKKKLGEGRSKVFLCEDTDNPGKDFAIKVLPVESDREEIKVFRKEFFTLQNLNHPNIIASHEEGTIVKKDDEEEIETGSRFILLDFFPGKEFLQFENINDVSALRIIIKQICSVLYYLHQSNYIYYDLKPENILIGKSERGLFIKLIDMGFAHHQSSSGNYISRGTREYIAPEILKREHQNHQADLYSFGIMLYRIVYGKFPFSSGEEVQIYKEHIEKEFEFPEDDVSVEMISSIKKMLEKNPVNRFDNSLQVLKNINADIDGETIQHFTPANIFAGRREIISEIKKLINNNNSKEVIILSGAEGSGKTSLLYKIYSECEKVILISSAGRRSGIGFIQFFLKKILYTDFIYPHAEKKIIELADLIIKGNSDNLSANLKSIFTGISSEIKFNLVVDDFNLLDDFLLDIFSEILPILQVNGVNIILSKRSDRAGAAEKFINKFRKINLTPFTEDELSEYLDIALASFFPKDQLKKLIIKYADLLPGSILSFIRDLILLKIIRFTYDGAEIIEDEKTEELLASSNEEIFRLRFSLLTPDEIKISQFLSSFENLPDINIISGFNNIPSKKINEIVLSLKDKNILQVSGIENGLSFTSESLKKYAYSAIENKEEYHLKIADYISDNFKEFNRNELAGQYESAKKFISSFEILSQEIKEAERLSAFSYKKNILNHLLTLSLPEEKIIELRLQLALTFYNLNDAKSALGVIEDTLNSSISDSLKNEFLILKGSSLIEIGEFEEGKELLNKLVKDVKDEERKQKIAVEIAYAEFDLGKYEVSEEFAKRILKNEFTSVEEKAKCHNLLGLVEIYLKNNLENSLKEFERSLEYYKQVNSVLQEAKLERNIGNIYNMRGEHSTAETFWNSAHKKNLSIGNLDQEAKHLLNYGIYHYEFAAFDEAIKQYKQAAEIFSILGNRFGEGLAYTNSGEVNIDICNYSDAFKSLTDAREIFNSLNNSEEEAEVLFLLGKLFAVIGDDDGLEKIIKEYKEKIQDASERHKNNINLLEYISGKEPNIDLIKDVKIKYLELNDISNYAKTNITHCEALLTSSRFKEAFDVINEEEFLQVCSKNSIKRAYREFLIGEISSKSENINPLINYNSSYEILKDNYVTELTWRVMLKLGELYVARGNFAKAESFIVYAKKLIYFIAGHITDNSLKEKYLRQKNRNKAIASLETLEKELSI